MNSSSIVNDDKEDCSTLVIRVDNLSDSAKEAIRFKFNPSGLNDVSRLKLLAAAFITECERIRDRNDGKAAREASVAITHMQTASMWGVLAATKE